MSTPNKTKLLGAGFTSTEIDNIASDVNNFGIDAVLAGTDDPAQKKAIQEVYGVEASVLTRESISNLFGVPDNDEKTGFKGFFGAGKTNSEKLDEFMDAIKQYQDVGFSDDKILKLMQG